MFRSLSCACGVWLIAIGLAVGAERVEPPPDAASVSAPALTLRQAIESALRGNPALQLFAFQFRIQDARVQQAGLKPAPALSFGVENFLGTGEARGLHTAEATFAISQVIELGGKREARIGAAQAGTSLVEADRQAGQLDVLAEVTRRFIMVASRQEQLRLARSATQLNEQTVTGAEERVNAARSPHVELDRAQIALSRARLVERRAETELESARKQLAALWGESELILNGQLVGGVDADLFQLPAVGEYADLVRRMADNPDFLRFASEARLRDAELRLVATLRKPDLTLTGGIRQLQGSNDQAFVASVSMPLFAGRRAEGYVAEARAQRERVDVERRVARVRAEAMLQELYQELSASVQEAGTLRTDVLPRAEEALQETKYAYERGRYSYLELVDAQREYLAIQSALIEASSNAHALRAEIERLTNSPLTGAP